MTARPALPEELRRGVKWARHPADVLPVWVADMDLGTAPVIVDRLRHVLDRQDLGYRPDPRPDLAAAFAAWQERNHGWSPPVEHVRVYVDVLQGIAAALRWATEPGDGVAVLTPVYPPFLAAVSQGGRRLVDVPLAGGERRVLAQRLEAAADGGARAMLVCNPHNPTGRVFDAEEVAAIARVVVERDLLLISDEIWADLVHPGATHRPLAAVDPEVAARTITLTSASKAFNLAGLRCAVGVVGPDRLRAALDALPPHLLGEPNTFGALAMFTAWTEGWAWLEATRRELTARRDQFGELLAQRAPQVGFRVPEGTYLAWLDLRATGLGDDPARVLLEEGRLALSPGLDFGPGGAGHARLNFATTPDLVVEAVERLAAVVDRHGATR